MIVTPKCPFCDDALKPYNTRNSETFYEHDQVDCPLSGYRFSPERIAIWSTRPEPSPLPDGETSKLIKRLDALAVDTRYDIQPSVRVALHDASVALTRLEADNAAKDAALAKAVRWFEEYADLHLAKSPSDLVKARSNQDKATELRAALHSQGQTIDG